jgi:putative peptide modification system cyclase
MNEFAQAAFDPASSPQVRTLLLTDLCDSTLLVERLGDAPAADLFRAHDRLVLELQQRWRGRLIDRSDGLLLLFERPVDGLGFALDYTRGLRELAERPEIRQRNLMLQARAGLHVGEVLTWHNSEAAVQAGAKPLEVEGLAKPLAGRLMTLARPGQILLSATAEPLARRAARELGERSEHLIWKSHGRWRFKGVPDGQEVFEVGEPGFAPLRAPKQNGGKAWRDIPLWRRPTALAAELMLVVGIGTGVWLLTRPTPAIAFNERDWVVVGDLRNLTGQPVLDESLEQAFRISLEQSRYVNVLSDLKVRDTLALMKRGPTTSIDRAIASEIAIRDGARAVILPTVAEVGGRVRVSAEVIDPHTQTTVYAESADGVGAESTLGSIDNVTAELREKLGEAISAIERDSEPLPKVSTNNLDALKAYALGQEKRYAGLPAEALAYFQRARRIDPQFALAIIAEANMHGVLGNLPAKRRALGEAKLLREHLSPKEGLILDAESARFGPVDTELARWKQLAEMYPDTHIAYFMSAQDGMFYANAFPAALENATSAAQTQFAMYAGAFYLKGIALLGLDRMNDAIVAFERSRSGGYRGEGAYYAFAYAAQGKYREADDVLRKQAAFEGARGPSPNIQYARMLIAIDRGELDAAAVAASAGLKLAAAEPLIAETQWRGRRLAIDVLRAPKDAALAEKLGREMDRIQSASKRSDVVFDTFSELQLLNLGYLGARIGDVQLIDRATTAVSTDRVAGYPLLSQMRVVLLAERARIAGDTRAAIKLLGPLVRRNDGLIAAHASLLRAATTAGDSMLVREETRWLARHRGRAYVEGSDAGLATPLTIQDARAAVLAAADLAAR